MKNHKSLRHKKQKLYKMKGCSRTRKNYLGGTRMADSIYLAYPDNKVPAVNNSVMAYTGRGGANCSADLITPSNLAYTGNTNGANPAYPSTGPTPSGFNFINSVPQRGGRYTNSCPGCGLSGVKINEGGIQRGGCGCAGIQLQAGGAATHRSGCKCSMCKRQMRGGSSVLSQSNNGIPYPNGLAGSPWTGSVSTWPGVDGVDGNRNYFPLNTYNNDVSRQMVDVGPAPPFTVGGRRNKRGKGLKGGTVSNFLYQDLVNLGRQVQFGFGSAYNALAGYQAPINPMPWKDQISTMPYRNPTSS